MIKLYFLITIGLFFFTSNVNAQSKSSTAELGFIKMFYANNPAPPIKRISKYEYSIPKTSEIDYNSFLDSTKHPSHTDVFNSNYKLDSSIYYRKNGEVRNFFKAKYDSLNRIIEFKDDEKFASLGMVQRFTYPSENQVVEQKLRNDGRGSYYIQHFNDRNNCIAEISLDDNKDTTSMIYYSYNIMGQIQSRVFINGNGTLRTSQIYLYDSLGSKIKLLSFDKLGQLTKEENITNSYRNKSSRYKAQSEILTIKKESLIRNDSSIKYSKPTVKNSKKSKSVTFYDQYGNTRKIYNNSHYFPNYVSITFIDIEYDIPREDK